MTRRDCYARHEAMKADPSRWSALPLVGRQVVPGDEAGTHYEIELRNCDQGCQSTLAREVTP